MATTTNYGWTTPDDTALVKDGAAAIRTLGSSVDTTTKALNPSTTLGDIEYRSSTANTNTRLGIGSTGQVLTVAGGVPSWATPAGGGKVLQVIYARTTTQVSSSSGSYASTGLTATITPSSATSKVLVIVNQNGLQKTAASSNNRIHLRLKRGVAFEDNFVSDGLDTATALLNNGSASYSYLDAPASTSALTYLTEFASAAGTSAVLVQAYGSQYSSITLLEIGA